MSGREGVVILGKLPVPGGITGLDLRGRVADRDARGRLREKFLALPAPVMFALQNMTEQERPNSVRNALPLAAAARRLGLSSDALRMRIYRGKAGGFKQQGRLFVYVDDEPNEPENIVRSRDPGRTSSGGGLVALQRAEIARLLRENARLASEIEQFLGLQEREQAIRQEIQQAVTHLAVARAAPAAEIARLEARIEHGERMVGHLAALIERLVERLERPRRPPAGEP